MAATVSHQHQLHFQQQEHQQFSQQPSPPSPPKSTSSNSSTPSSSSGSFLNGELSHSSPAEHFCKDCGVMFESSTSLEVHLSYHKENLLTRWANQDSSSSSEKSAVTTPVSNPSTSPHTNFNHPASNNSSSSSSSLSDPGSMPDMSTSGSSSNSHPPTPHSIDNGSGGANSQRFFPTGPASSNGGGSGEHGQYPPVSQYGGSSSSASSNGSEQDQPAQQHSMEHPYRPGGGMNGPNNNFSQQQQPPPVDMNGQQQQHSLNGNMPQHSPYQSTIMIAQNHIFSPNHHNQQQPPPGSEHHRGGPPPPGNTEQGTAAAIRESAEILDLDSHKVHLYQPPPPERHYFTGYGLPPMFGNGWGHPGVPPEHHQFSPHGHHPPPHHPGFGDPHHPIPPYPLHAQNPPPPPHHLQHPHHPHHHVQPPPPPTSVYDMERQNPPPQFSSEPPPAPLDYPPSSQHAPPPPPVSVQNQMGSGPPPFGQPNVGPGFTPIAAQPADNRQERISMSSPLAPSPAQKSPNEATTPASSAASTQPKTKGWKGGECKRPKTYNCTACNKWFTSSGHLKRHYGTTLHKNSMKQKDLPEEPPPPPKRGKNGMSKQAQAAAAAAAAAAANNNNAELIRDRSPLKDFGLKGSDGGNNGRSGYAPSPPIIHGSPAPPKISPGRIGSQVDDMIMMDSKGPLHHGKPPGHMIGTSPAFNIPSGFKSYESQALNPDSNNGNEHHQPSFLGGAPQPQRLFNPAISHHHPQFYAMPPHAPPPFMNGFASDNGQLPPSSQYVG